MWHFFWCIYSSPSSSLVENFISATSNSTSCLYSEPLTPNQKTFLVSALVLSFCHTRDISHSSQPAYTRVFTSTLPKILLLYFPSSCCFPLVNFLWFVKPLSTPFRVNLLLSRLLDLLPLSTRCHLQTYWSMVVLSHLLNSSCFPHLKTSYQYLHNSDVLLCRILHINQIFSFSTCCLYLHTRIVKSLSIFFYANAIFMQTFNLKQHLKTLGFNFSIK